MSRGRTNRPATWVAVALGIAALLFGVVGIAAAGEVVLLRMPEPGSLRARAWRVFGLTALTTALLAGLAGGLYFSVRNAQAGESASIVAFAFLEGGVIAGFAGALFGSLVGAVLGLDHHRREPRG